MMWEPVILITKAPEVNENGVTMSTEHRKKIYGSRESVKRTEYYSALKAGDQPTVTIVLWFAEFLEANISADTRIFEPTELICGGIRYKIGRTWNVDGSDKVELTCSKIM